MIMTQTAQLDQPKIERDRFDRPLVIPPEGGEPIAYTRATTYAGALDDRYNLGRWEMRMVAVGMMQRPDLIMRIGGLGSEPKKGAPGYKEWHRSLDSVADAAKEAAAASQWATIGTALHAYTERIDQGVDLGHVPSEYQPHLDAYIKATAGFESVAIERFMVQDFYRIGGTPDRILKIPGHDKLIIGDVKTGDTDFGVGKMAIQLGIYAHCLHYDPATGYRTDPGDIDQETGLIIALNARTGQCELKWIDIAAGWDAVDLAHQVRAWRSRRKWYVPAPVGALPTLREQHALPADETGGGSIMDPVNAALITAIDQAESPDQLVELWRAAGPRWTDEHTQRAALRKAVIMS
jgi:hypothetical protein